MHGNVGKDKQKVAKVVPKFEQRVQCTCVGFDQRPDYMQIDRFRALDTYILDEWKQIISAWSPLPE